MQEHLFRIENRRGDSIFGDVRFVEDDEGAKPVVVMCHGFKGFKDWGTFPTWGRRLAEDGFVSVLFNFSYNGVSPEQPTEFTQLDLFADNTYTRELDDVAAVLDAVAGATLPAPVDPARIGLMGHSRGGGIALLQAADDTRIRALVTWSAVAGFIERFTEEQLADWEEQSYTTVLNARTGQRMRLNRVLYDDAMAHRDRLDVRAAAARIDIPWLIVHAPDDEAVPFEEAEILQEQHTDAELFTAAGGHTFGGSHPFDGPLPETLAPVFDRTAAFFKAIL